MPKKNKPVRYEKHNAYKYLVSQVYLCQNTCPVWELCPEAQESKNTTCPILSRQFVNRLEKLEEALCRGGRFKINEGQRILIKDIAILEGFTTLVELYVLRNGPFITKGKDIRVVNVLGNFYLACKNSIRRNITALGLTGILDPEGKDQKDPLQAFWEEKMAGGMIPRP